MSKLEPFLRHSLTKTMRQRRKNMQVADAKPLEPETDEQRLSRIKFNAEQEMKAFDRMPRVVRDGLNYQKRHKISAEGILHKHYWLSKIHRFITYLGVYNLARMNRIKLPNPRGRNGR